jgi:hypothetical protein
MRSSVELPYVILLLAVVLVAFAAPAAASVASASGGHNRLSPLPARDATGLDASLPADATQASVTAQVAWRPGLVTSWQLQLTTPVDQSVDAALYDVDLFDNDASVVAALHARGRRVVCYLSAGTWENWRPDASAFPAVVKGRGNGWPGERWLDIRRLDVLGPIMQARLDQCKAKGFDGVDPDNMDGYTNTTGFPLTAADQLQYNRYLADAAHARGLAVGLKNDLDQIPDLVSAFDWALNEQCFEYSECNTLLPFIQAGKPVFQVEYNRSPSRFCAQANALNFNSLRKHLSLDAYRVSCR